MSDIYLGLDLGTSGCKLIAFDELGNEVAHASRSYEVVNPRPGWFELDAELVWSQAGACFREVCARALSGLVRTLAISVLGEAVIPVDRSGRALGPGIISADMRAEEQVRVFGERVGAERIYAITGQPLASIYSLPKLMWLKKYQPGLANRAWKFLCFGDYALMQLGLPPTIDEGMAARMMAFDIERKVWSRELLEAAGFTPLCLADVAASGSVLGVIAPDIAAWLALPEGVQVVLGGHDQPMGALGAGAVTPGDAVYSLGTTEALVVPLRSGSAKLFARNIPCYPHAIPDLRVALAGNQSGGRVLAWHHKVMDATPDGMATSCSFDERLACLDDQAPNWPILLPHFLGSGSVLNDNDSLGALFGLRFETSGSDMLLSVLEGITFEQALSLEILAEATGPIETLRVIGGGTRSPFWLQMKADILNRPLTTITVQDASCLGAAILGCAALDRQRPLEEIARSMVATGQTFNPRAGRHAVHAERLEIYRSLYEALRPLASRLRAQWGRVE